MPRRKFFYAIAECQFLSEPIIFTHWEKAQAWVTKCPGAKFKGFHTLEEAKLYLEQLGFHDYQMDIEHDLSDQRLSPTSPHYYSVSQGRETGMFTSYRDGAQPQVHKYSGACHKAYGTEEACAKATRLSQNEWESREKQEEIWNLMNVLHH
ncbi:hypothetical protein CLAIMM_01844 isoform 1 [Cladophialophora immunda]|nr:hypothetical protein CLAIMM_01844 isoform 1 [Cladophialophora immunda]